MMTAQPRYMPEVDSFTLIGTTTEIPSVEFRSEVHLPRRLGLDDRPAATILIRLADDWVDQDSKPADEIAIASDCRLGDLTRAIDILTASRAELGRVGEGS